MELIAHLHRRLARLRYVYGWRLRYWWLDTPGGRHARVTLAVLGLMGAIGEGVCWFADARRPPMPGQPHQSIIGVIIVLIIALLVAVIAIATMPKPKGPQPTQASTPTTTDGQQVVDAFGTVWTDDSFILAWKQMGTEPIKASGGK